MEMKLRYWILLFPLLAVGCGDSDKEIRKMAYKADANGDYVVALALFTKLAEKGEANSQSMMGRYYFQGLGVTKNMYEARAWYIKAAKQGNFSALNNLANSYKYDREDSPNYSEAIKWYKECVAISACFVEFGDMYERGLGVEVDYAEAVKLYKMGADQELEGKIQSNDARLIEKSRAEFHLANMYINGLGVQQNCAEANRLLLLAANRNTIYSQIAKNKLQEVHCADSDG